MISVAISGVSATSCVLAVPPRHVVHLGEDAVRRVVLGLADEAALVQVLDQRLAVAGRRQPRDHELEVRDRRRDALEQAEVDERHAPVVEQQRVAGVRVAGELVVAVHAAEVEAKDDLAEAVALGLGQLLELLEAASGDELRDDHALVRQRGDDLRHDDERVAAVDPRERALVLRLELVVELLVDARADLVAHRLRIQARRDPLHEPQDHPEVAHVRAHRLRDAGVLHLDRHVAAVVQLGLVHLTDRGGGDRHRVERLEDLADGLAVLGLDDLAHVLEGDLRRGVAQLGELGLKLLAVLLGHEADVEERHHLAELHRRALHRPERRDDLLGGLELALGRRALLALVGARDVRRARAHLLGGRRGRQPPDLRRTAQTRGRDRVLVRHQRCTRRATTASARPSSRGRCRRARRPSAPTPCGRRRSPRPTRSASPDRRAP